MEKDLTVIPSIDISTRPYTLRYSTVSTHYEKVVIDNAS